MAVIFVYLNTMMSEKRDLLCSFTEAVSDWISYNQFLKKNIYFSSEVYITCSPKEQILCFSIVGNMGDGKEVNEQHLSQHQSTFFLW